MIVGSVCICMDPAKLSAIVTWPLLKMVKAICSFLGFCNFYHKFIPGFSNIIAPLTALMCKDQLWHWDSTHQTAFDTLLLKFQTTPVLYLPDIHHPFVVMTDASLLASGGVLMQQDKMVISTPAGISCKLSLLQSGITTSTTENCSLSSMPSITGNNISREPNILSPSSLTTKT